VLPGSVSSPWLLQKQVFFHFSFYRKTQCQIVIFCSWTKWHVDFLPLSNAQ
jgi:hypothetical protein